MKTFTFAVAAPLLVALFGSIVNTSPAPAYPGCEAASNAAAIGDETALKNAIAACKSASFKRPSHKRETQCLNITLKSCNFTAVVLCLNNEAD